MSVTLRYERPDGSVARRTSSRVLVSDMWVFSDPGVMVPRERVVKIEAHDGSEIAHLGPHLPIEDGTTKSDDPDETETGQQFGSGKLGEGQFGGGA